MKTIHKLFHSHFENTLENVSQMMIGFFVWNDFDWRSYLQSHKEGIMWDLMEFSDFSFFLFFKERVWPHFMVTLLTAQLKSTAVEKMHG